MKSRHYELQVGDLHLLMQIEHGKANGCAVSGLDQTEVARVDRALASLLCRAEAADLFITAASDERIESRQIATTLIREHLGLSER